MLSEELAEEDCGPISQRVPILWILDWIGFQTRVVLTCDALFYWHSYVVVAYAAAYAVGRASRARKIRSDENHVNCSSGLNINSAAALTIGVTHVLVLCFTCVCSLSDIGLVTRMLAATSWSIWS